MDANSFKNKPCRKTPEAVVIKFLNLCKQMPAVKAAKKIGLPRRTAYAIAIEEGIIQKGMRQKRKPISPEEAQAVMANISKGSNIKDEAKRVGVCERVLYNRIKPLGYVAKSWPREPNSNELHMKAAKEALQRINDGAKICEEAKRMGVCITTLRKRIDAVGYIAQSKGARTAARKAAEAAAALEFNAYVPATHRRCRQCIKIRLLDFFYSETICVYCAK